MQWWRKFLSFIVVNSIVSQERSLKSALNLFLFHLLRTIERRYRRKKGKKKGGEINRCKRVKSNISLPRVTLFK